MTIYLGIVEAVQNYYFKKNTLIIKKNISEKSISVVIEI